MPKKTSIAVAAVVGVVVGLAGIAPAQAHHNNKAPAAGTGGGSAAANPLATLLAQLFPPPPTTAPPTTTTTTVPVKNLDTGASGPAVKRLEERLNTLRYFVGKVDDKYDDDTFQAVMAFQKVNRLPRTGTVDGGSLWSAMQSATTPAPLVPDGGAHRVEVDLGRQVLFLYNGNQLDRIVSVSSGTSATPTPTGDYRIYRFDPGWHNSALGRLYNAEYFIGGYAIHGSLSVPERPASHGCVRIPMTAADWFPDQVGNGTPVYIR